MCEAHGIAGGWPVRDKSFISKESKMRKAIGLAVLAACLLSACLTATAGEKTYRIGGATYGLNGEYMKLWATALERHPAVKSGMVKLTVFDGRYDASVQQSQFETMSSQGYDAIIFVPIDIEAGASAAQYKWYPRGSGPQPGVKTAAKVEIWSRGAQFRAGQDRFAGQAAALQRAAAGGDPVAIRAEARKLGATCKACHDAFRAD